MAGAACQGVVAGSPGGTVPRAGSPYSVGGVSHLFWLKFRDSPHP
jgi:hypothetical protein